MNQPDKPVPSYETRDTNFKAILSLIGLLFLVLGGSVLMTKVMEHFLLHYSPLRDEPRSSFAEMHRLPPEPRLQVNPPVDLIRLRDIENVQLSNYSWMDATSGNVHIPITRAMAILVEHGLPTRPQEKNSSR